MGVCCPLQSNDNTVARFQEVWWAVTTQDVMVTRHMDFETWRGETGVDL
jgi:hypothetical protein